MGGMLRNKLKAVASSIMLENCRTGAIVEVDDKSSVTANQLRYIGMPSEDIFVHSISYDGTSDIANDPVTPTSVWGPLRTVTVKGNNNVKYGALWNGTAPTGFSAVTGIADKAGVLGDLCPKLTISPGVSAYRSFGFQPVVGKYYFWSVHSFFISGDKSKITSSIGNGTFVLGKLILKSGQWACSYGIKKCTAATSNPVALTITNLSTAPPAVLRLADVQILEFDSFAEAVSFAGSRAFAVKKTSPLTDYEVNTPFVNAYFRWVPGGGTFEIESGFNVLTITRTGTGNYYIQFILPLDSYPVPQLSFLENSSKIIGHFTDLSNGGIRVKLINKTGDPVDGSFSLSVF